MKIPLYRIGNLCGIAAPLLARAGASIIGGACFRRVQELRNLSLYSVASGVLGLLFLVLMALGAEPRTAAGLYERLSSGVLSLWVLVVAIRLWRRGQPERPRPG